MLKQRIINKTIDNNINNVAIVRKVAMSMSNCTDSYNALTNVFKTMMTIKNVGDEFGDNQFLLEMAITALNTALTSVKEWKNTQTRDKVLVVIQHVVDALNHVVTIVS